MRHVGLGIAVLLACGTTNTRGAGETSPTGGSGTATDGTEQVQTDSQTGAASGTETGAGTVADTGADETGGPESCDPSPRLDVPFADPGAGAELTMLDVHPGAGTSTRPVVVWVHGGGWVGGDKASHERNPDFARFFADEGYVLVSINYRLVNDPDNPGMTFAEQATDIASALGWVVEHAPEFCGDPDDVHLVGYSAGAHLVALVGADGDYLGAQGLAPQDLASIVSLDANSYDIPWAIENAAAHNFPASATNLPAIFGDQTAQLQASPITFITGQPVPPSFVVSAPVKDGVMQTLSRVASERYVDALVVAGNEALTWEALGESHTTLTADFGSPNDEATAQVAAFLAAH